MDLTAIAAFFTSLVLMSKCWTIDQLSKWIYMVLLDTVCYTSQKFHQDITCWLNHLYDTINYVYHNLFMLKELRLTFALGFRSPNYLIILTPPALERRFPVINNTSVISIFVFLYMLVISPLIICLYKRVNINVFFDRVNINV